MSNVPRSVRACVLTLLSVFASPHGHGAMTYGIFEARGMAMGGATVAAGDNNNALFYNPSLLAFYSEHEENTQDSRFLFPLIVPQLSDSTIDAENFTGSNPDDSLTGVVDQFNADPSAVNADAVVAVTRGIESDLAGLSGQDLTADIYVGIAGIQPSKRQGGGFFLGARIIGGGAANITEDDITLLRAYQEGLTFIATGGAEGVERPELFEADGTLRNPNQDFDSTLEGDGALFSELGVAMSKEIHLGRHPLAIGMNFKVLRVDTFEEVQRVIDGSLGVSDNRGRHLTLNADVGVAKEFGLLRLGLAVKDIVPEDFDTALETPIKLRPRPRLGAAYQLEALQIGLDVDLARNRPLSTEPATQEAALGMEWPVLPKLKLRAGIRHDLRGERDSIFSLGLGTSWRRFLFDIAYADGGDATAGALQFGVAF